LGRFAFLLTYISLIGDGGAVSFIGHWTLNSGTIATACELTKNLSQKRKQLQNVSVTMNQRLPRAIANTNIVRKRTEIIRGNFGQLQG
jgi:hypothetical protein